MSDTPRHPAAWPGRCDIPACPQCDPPPRDLANLARCGPATAALLDRLSTHAPASDSGSWGNVDAQGGIPERGGALFLTGAELQGPALGPVLRYRLLDAAGRLDGGLYHRISDAVEAAIQAGGERVLYREMPNGDLSLLARISGRKG